MYKKEFLLVLSIQGEGVGLCQASGSLGNVPEPSIGSGGSF